MFLGCIKGTNNQPWTITLKMNGTNMTFKIDTGANVTVISDKEYSRSRDGALREFSQMLQGAGKSKLPVLGEFTATIVK